MDLATGAGAVYDVTVEHSRRSPVVNSFSYRTVMWLVDPLRPPPLPRWLRRVVRFEAADHLDVLALLAEQGIHPSRCEMLTTPRCIGFAFNPISVHWCYGPEGETLAQVAEVHNTYGDRHAYIFHPDEDGEAEVAKRMYVSPFYPVDGSYRLVSTSTTDTIEVTTILNRQGDEPFRAGLRARRRTTDTARLRTAGIRTLLVPFKVRSLIQWQGIKLWARGVKVQPR